MASPEQPPVPLLFLIGDTGGGHRSAAAAVAQALDRLLPGQFVPVICDPLRGPDVPRLLRWLAGLYGPCIRLTPWLWWLFWRTTDSPRVLGAVRRTVMGPVYGSVSRATAACRPALIVAFHPMTADPAVRARDRTGPLAPVVTVITDLVTAHRSWRDAAVDRVIVPSEEMAVEYAKEAEGTGREVTDGRYVPLGLPVGAEFCQPALGEAERRELKRELGLSGNFLVVLTGGAEGSGGLRRRAAAIMRQVDDIDVAVICGRNRSLNRRVARLAGRSGRGRLSAHGFVGNMADWLRCADIVVGKAGPGTIAEATCCGAPLVLTSFVPGQEKGNAEFVTGSGAGVYAPRPRQLAAEVGRLRRDSSALAAMRDASVQVSRPRAAADIARFIASLSGVPAAGGGEHAGRDLLPTLIGDLPKVPLPGRAVARLFRQARWLARLAPAALPAAGASRISGSRAAMAPPAPSTAAFGSSPGGLGPPGGADRHQRRRRDRDGHRDDGPAGGHDYQPSQGQRRELPAGGPGCAQRRRVNGWLSSTVGLTPYWPSGRWRCRRQRPR